MTKADQGAARERNRLSSARHFGLPDTASHEFLQAAARERNRLSAAKLYGLPDTATHEDIQAAAREALG